MQSKYFPRLKDLREDTEKNQEDIANIIGTSQSYYAQYESGKRSIPFERIVDIAKYYNVSIDYIAGLTNDKRGIGYANEKKGLKQNKYEKGLNQIIQVAEDLKKIN